MEFAEELEWKELVACDVPYIVDLIGVYFEVSNDAWQSSYISRLVRGLVWLMQHRS